FLELVQLPNQGGSNRITLARDVGQDREERCRSQDTPVGRQKGQPPVPGPWPGGLGLVPGRLLGFQLVQPGAILTSSRQLLRRGDLQGPLVGVVEERI